jgi:hypothetical protein
MSIEARTADKGVPMDSQASDVRTATISGDRNILSDVKILRERARQHVERGAVTTDYRIAIESYRELILFIGDRDPTTRRLLADVLAAEEEHANDLTSLMFVDGDAASVRNG